MSEDEMPEGEQNLFLSEEAIFALVSTLATEVVKYGEEESLLIESKSLKDNEALSVMKANTLLTVFALLLVKVVESKDLAFATTVVNCWISPAVQDMVQIAFAEEIEQAATMVTNGIADLEAAINKETNAQPPSEQGD